MIDPAPGEIIEPALAVVQIPEGDSGDDVAVFVKQLEQRDILFNLLLLNLFRKALLVGSLSARGASGFGRESSGSGNNVFAIPDHTWRFLITWMFFFLLLHSLLLVSCNSACSFIVAERSIRRFPK